MTDDAGPRFYLNECTREQTSSGLMGSWDPGGISASTAGTTATSATRDTLAAHLQDQLLLSESHDLTSKELCAVPVGLCHAVKGGAALSKSMELLSPDIRVLCTNSGCDYGGTVHRSCLDRWSSCCELRCRMLASLPMPSTRQSGHQPSPLTEATNAMLDGLLSLYRCPRCGQCTLCRMTLNSAGKPTPAPSDPHANVFGAMQYVSQQGNPIGFHATESGLGVDQCQSGEVTPSNGVSTTEDGASDVPCINTPVTSNYASLTAEEQFGTDMPMDPRKRASWHTAWSSSLNTPGPLAQYHMNQQSQLLRRLSLRCANSTGSTSSGSTSGFGSGGFGSSFSATGESSYESSRRSSRNTDTNDVFRPNGHPIGGVGGGHVTLPDDTFTTGWVGSGATSTAPRALRGSGSLGPLRHSFSVSSGCSSGVTQLIDPLSMLRSHSPGSAGSNTPDAHDAPSPCDAGFASHMAPGLARRHHSTSCVGSSKGPSFWPSDPDKTRTGVDCLEAQKRKVVSCKGNIFRPRRDFTVFQTLPAHKRNAYFIQMDDDSCTGNEDTRAFLLAQLTSHRISEVACLACHRALVVYDHFPVVDGIFFISPVCHRSTSQCGRHMVSGLRVTWHTNGVPTGIQPAKLSSANADVDEISQESVQKLLGSGLTVVPPPGCLGPRQQVAGNHAGPDGSVSLHHPYQQQLQHGSASRRHGTGRQERYLHALCMDCMHPETPAVEDGAKSNRRKGGIYCRNCSRPWSGVALLVGGLYTYDVLASWPCCTERFTCNACGRLLVNPNHLSSNDDRAGVCGSAEKENDTASSVSASASMEHTASSSNCPFPFFSQYSQLITCPGCGKVDYHFVKQFCQQYHTAPAGNESAGSASIQPSE